MIAFGPVPSRRLGHSMGINNIPPKNCTYSCIYCQLGRTDEMQLERQEFYPSEKIIEDVNSLIKKARAADEHIDYLTFVPDGEPTLDVNLGNMIKKLKNTGYKIAVISNSSLIWRQDIRDELAPADWVSLKVDAVTEEIWHKIDRPHGHLKLDKILDGISEFSRNYEGELATETMLIQGVNDSPDELNKIAEFIGKLKSKKSYISIPTRPPAENWVKAASEENINMAYQIFREHSIDVEHLIGYEGNEFAFTGNVEEDILSITSVHPMRKDAMEELLRKSMQKWSIIDDLIDENKLVETEYRGNKYYLRNLHDNH